MTRMLHDLSGRYGVLPAGAEHGEQAALHRLWTLAYREASTLAYADAFKTVMLAFIIAAVLVPLLRKVGAPTPAIKAAH